MHLFALLLLRAGFGDKVVPPPPGGTAAVPPFMIFRLKKKRKMAKTSISDSFQHLLFIIEGFKPVLNFWSMNKFNKMP
jgi:hypothetical protein